MTDFRALCAELAEQLDGATDPCDLSIHAARMVAQIRAALDEPEGEGPTPIDYRRWHDAHSEECNTWSEQLTPPLNLRTTVEALAWAKHCLARWGRHAPAPKPIPVSERPWERDGWRDTEGRCWFCNAYSMGRWNYQLPPDSEQDWGMLGTETHCLPHWAIARPRPEAKG